MFRGIVISLVLATCFIGAACVASAQNVSGRTQDLVAQLDKTKHKVKDKRGTHFESYTDVRNEASTRKLGDLAGHYVSRDMSDLFMDLTVNSDGTATAAGTTYEMVGENSVRMSYTFKGRVDGALLTGTRTLENGKTGPFEAVFVNRTVHEGTTPAEATVTYQGFGLGYLEQNENWTNRVFMEKK
ncbi:MAG TPA: hypothetical protein VGI80_07415 [Pyrinomonadaceae bacterium]